MPGAKREVNQDIPHDWTDWFDAEPPDHPLSELTPKERAAAEKNAKKAAAQVKSYREAEQAARPS